MGVCDEAAKAPSHLGLTLRRKKMHNQPVDLSFTQIWWENSRASLQRVS